MSIQSLAKVANLSKRSIYTIPEMKKDRIGEIVLQQSFESELSDLSDDNADGIESLPEHKQVKVENYKLKIKELLTNGPMSDKDIRSKLAGENSPQDWLVMEAVDAMNVQLSPGGTKSKGQETRDKGKQLDRAINKKGETPEERVVYFLKEQENDLVKYGRLSKGLTTIKKPIEFYEPTY